MDSFIRLTTDHHASEMWIRASAIVMIREIPAQGRIKTMICMNDDAEYYVRESVKTVMEAISGRKLDLGKSHA